MNDPRPVSLASAEPVLIVGAGPTGLTLACALARHGVPHVLIDRKAHASHESKGLAVNIACQFLFTLLGTPMQPGPHGCRLERLNLLWQGRAFSAIDFRHLDFPIRSLISQPQPDTEQQLEAALTMLGGGQPRWQTELVGLASSDNGVWASLRGMDGETRREHFSCVVGCDGKHSLVREHLGATMDGHGYPMHFVLGDFELDWPGEPGQVYYHVHPQDFFILIPLHGRCWRVVVKYDGDVPAEQPLVDAMVREPVTRLLGRDIFRSASSWLSRAPFYGRVAGYLRQGRCFIAGDAAHLVSPIGGTGMNAGMQDAFNLAWKLSLCLRGQALAALLDSYEPERLEAVRANGDATDLATRLIARLNTDLTPLAPLLPKMGNRAVWRTQLPRQYSGLAQHYSQGMLVPKQNPLAGGFALPMLDVVAWLASHGQHPPSDALWLMVGAGADADLPGLSTLAQRYPTQLRVVYLGSPAAMPVASGVFAAPWPASVPVPVPFGQLQLWRPDGVIAFAGEHRQLDALSDWLADWLVPAQAPVGAG
ncbi:FAD-dependent monooxygenase [Rivihabitans pingtungensis]|uniref:2-polyprenyl-6-methoxyphenol hydroxylase-like FAD-dependent oxidoreductase n=1 Tax=Rivihabitans pingtungensis TaxID=1054498 RepID=A0A318KNN5_9NEIS|nr:FAD-dependent monooxygenase [Rivihabitans pingtungensis]PXX79240.1 2-polyprenyl-6-methoxyphenol hydroxylase-like FAD-dependent oxidoreductase [Rivihabitans pingtungensis]